MRENDADISKMVEPTCMVVVVVIIIIV